MKIRIGNDICLSVSLLGSKCEDYMNVKSMKAYLINVTRQQDIDEQHRHDSIDYRNELDERRGMIKYISRFPAEPHCPGYHGTPYDLCHSGYPTFHVHPVHVVAPYIGFGVHPHTFDPYHNHLWGYDDLQDIHAKMLYKEEEYKKQYGECEYLAEVHATEQQGKVNVFFPAESQLHIGVYKLVIIAKVYEPGYAPNNLRTVTMDYNTVFELVNSSAEACPCSLGTVVVEVGNGSGASRVEIVGNMTIPQGALGHLFATVYPLNIDLDTVLWEVISDPSGKLVFTQNGNECRYGVMQLPEGMESCVIKLRATSVKSKSIYKDVEVTILNEPFYDKYVNPEAEDLGYTGAYEENGEMREYINLPLVGGGTAKVDTTKETVWYEGD